MTRQICPSRIHCCTRLSTIAHPAAKSASPKLTAVSGVGTSATAPAAMATTPNPIRMFMPSAPVGSERRELVGLLTRELAFFDELGNVQRDLHRAPPTLDPRWRDDITNSCVTSASGP